MQPIVFTGDSSIREIKGTCRHMLSVMLGILNPVVRRSIQPLQKV